jgi:hypothetical protein
LVLEISKTIDLESWLYAVGMELLIVFDKCTSPDYGEEPMIHLYKLLILLDNKLYNGGDEKIRTSDPGFSQMLP